MQVFGTKFLEPMQGNTTIPVEAWKWVPAGGKLGELHASGRSTGSRESTYAGESDNRADVDRPNEGLAA